MNVRQAHPEMRAPQALLDQIKRMHELSDGEAQMMFAANRALAPMVHMARVVQRADPAQMAVLGRSARHETIDNLSQFMPREILTPYDRKI